LLGQGEAMMIRGGSPRMGEPLNKSFHDRSLLDSNPCRFGVSKQLTRQSWEQIQMSLFQD
jgi:hypothetical protein